MTDDVAPGEAAGDAVLDGWLHQRFTAGDLTRETYRKGRGPGVVVMHDLVLQHVFLGL